MSGGRPTKYKKEYCKKLIEHMSQGYSIGSFAGVVKVNKDTVYEWINVNKEFKEAKEYGESLSLLWWEKSGMDGMRGAIPGFNATMWVFNMKNRFKWKDLHETKVDIEVDVKKQEALVYNVLGLSDPYIISKELPEAKKNEGID